MKTICSFEPHLILREITLLRGCEWNPSLSAWLFIGIKTGAAYWLNSRKNHDLPPGSVIVLSSSAKGTIHCSQLAETQLAYFRVEPKLLSGLATFHEEQLLCRAALEESNSVRIFGPGDPIAQSFGAVCENPDSNHLGLRLRLLDLFVRSLWAEIKTDKTEETDGSANARTRLAELLKEIPACELMKMDFTDLARELCCTPRHLSRTFHEVVGVSFRQRQAEIRMNRAKELLATTRSKVLDVALESGYQSLSLFNLMFKRHAGITPAKWREQMARRRTGRGGQGTELLRSKARVSI